VGASMNAWIMRHPAERSWSEWLYLSSGAEPEWQRLMGGVGSDVRAYMQRQGNHHVRHVGPEALRCHQIAEGQEMYDCVFGLNTTEVWVHSPRAQSAVC